MVNDCRVRVWFLVGMISVLGGVCLPAGAEVISDTQILFAANNSIPGSSYEATVAQDVGGNPTSIFFGYDGGHLSFVATALDEGSDWYLVNNGDVFSAGTIAGGGFPVLFRWDTGSPGALSIPLGDFYLGMNTGLGSPIGEHRDVFGWIELNNTGSELIPVGNAVAYGEGGIVVGTTTAVPEPGTVGLLGVVVLVVGGRRRALR